MNKQTNRINRYGEQRKAYYIKEWIKWKNMQIDNQNMEEAAVPKTCTYGHMLVCMN